MSTDYATQTCTGHRDFNIQFHTDYDDLYRLVEKVCREAVDEAVRRRKEKNDGDSN